MPEPEAALKFAALRYLARREYSRAELAKKLALKFGGNEHGDALIEAVLDRFQASNMLSDRRYANVRAQSRGRRLGNARLKHELAQQGVSAEEIDKAVAQAGDETERCRTVWQKKFSRLPASSVERARQMRFLQYRGFSADAVRAVLAGAR